ncbi:MAG: DUF6624 domain-containing protein [Bacteroidota bacterium]
MNRVFYPLALALVWFLLAPTATAQPASPLDEDIQRALRTEIAEMLHRDQQVRYMQTVGTFSPALADSIGEVLSALPMEEYLAMTDSLEREAEQRLTQAEQDSLIAIMRTADRAHIVRLREIVETHGWPDSTRIGGSSNPFIFLLHTSPDTLESMLDLLRTEVDAGRMAPRQFAMAVDKSRKIRGERQLYGSGMEFDPETRSMVPPVVDSIDATNRAREAIGLPPLTEYRLPESATMR